MKTIEELNKYIASVCLAICTPLLIWMCVSLQEVKVGMSVLQTQMKELTRSIDAVNAVAQENRTTIQINRERIIVLETIQNPKKKFVTTKNLQSFMKDSTPFEIIDTDGKGLDKLADVDIINYY